MCVSGLDGTVGLLSVVIGDFVCHWGGDVYKGLLELWYGHDLWYW